MILDLFVCPLQYSLCNEPLIELSNPGASGSVFYVTKDDEFIIKTVMHKEAEFLQKLLPGYYMVRFLNVQHFRFFFFRVLFDIALLLRCSEIVRESQSLLQNIVGQVS